MPNPVVSKKVPISEYLSSFGRYHKIPLEEYTFSEGLKGKSFNPNNLYLEEQKKFGEVLGFMWDLMQKPVETKQRIYIKPYHELQNGFIEKYLKKGIDLKEDDAGKIEHQGRHKIHNPFITYYCRYPLPPVGPTLEDAILSGVLTNVAIKTVFGTGNKKRLKLIHIDHSNLIFKTIRNFANIRLLSNIPFNYFKNVHGTPSLMNSIWFYDSEQVAEILIENTEDYCKELELPSLYKKTKELPNFNCPEGALIVLLEQERFNRARTYEELKYEGRLTISQKDELKNELKFIEKNIRNLSSLLKKSQGEDQKSIEELQSQHANLQYRLDELNGLRGKRKSRYENEKALDNFRAQERYHMK